MLSFKLVSTVFSIIPDKFKPKFPPAYMFIYHAHAEKANLKV